MCPKCNGPDFSGPKFMTTHYGYEYLEYTCTTCGYKKLEPTKDADSEETKQRNKMREDMEVRIMSLKSIIDY
jgi:RNase P subunit RPR2